MSDSDLTAKDGVQVLRPWWFARALPPFCWGAFFAFWTITPFLTGRTPLYQSADIVVAGLLMLCFVGTLLHAIRYRLVLDEGRGIFVIHGALRTKSIPLTHVASIRYRRLDLTRIVVLDSRGRRLWAFPATLPAAARLIRELDAIAKNNFGANAGLEVGSLMPRRL